jgi:hypothetical protein
MQPAQIQPHRNRQTRNLTSMVKERTMTDTHVDQPEPDDDEFDKRADYDEPLPLDDEPDDDESTPDDATPDDEEQQRQ